VRWYAVGHGASAVAPTYAQVVMYIAYGDESGDDGSVIVSRCRQGPVGSQHGQRVQNSSG